MYQPYFTYSAVKKFFFFFSCLNHLSVTNMTNFTVDNHNRNIEQNIYTICCLLSFSYPGVVYKPQTRANTNPGDQHSEGGKRDRYV